MWKKEGNEFEMKPTNANSGDKEDPPKKEPSKVECQLGIESFISVFLPV